LRSREVELFAVIDVERRGFVVELRVSSAQYIRFIKPRDTILHYTTLLIRKEGEREK
jgi:hypothetical protein